MAMNPMQRRARNSFLMGFLVALIIMALVVFGLLQRIKKQNDEMEALLSKQTSVLVASDDLESGEVVTFVDNFTTETVQTTVDPTTVISSEDFEAKDENGEFLYNEDGTTVAKEMIMKVNVPKGTIVTKDMLVESGEETQDSDRIAEFNMILLPSQMKNGDYIDIRLTLPSGQDYIVLTKKKVLGCTASSVWLKLQEDEILRLNNAIVESYYIIGSKLYALPYTEPGLQVAATPTYIESDDVVKLMNTDPNVTETARRALSDRYYALSEVRTNQISSAIANSVETEEQKGNIVQGKLSNEIEAIKSARQSFVESLEGTDDVGFKK